MEGIADAFYDYHDALGDILEASQQTDLDGNYTRFAEKALRVAMLLASFGNDGHIEMRHWARGQQIAERWRVGLHALYDQVNEPDPSEAAQIEEKILGIVERLGEPTLRDISRMVWGMGATDVEPFVLGLVRTGFLSAHKKGRTTVYQFTKDV